MQVKAEDLGGQLRGAMQCVYLVSGDELLLVNEVCDQIVAAARQQGFVERTTYHVEPGFKWHDLYHDAASLSLFAEKKLLDVRLTAKKFDKAASEFLREWTDNDAEADAILMLRCDRLQPKQRASVWFKALEKQGIVVLIWPVSAAQLPRWLSQRLKQQGLQLESDAIQYLCDRVEGNLLAAAQEVEKLQLLDLPNPISLETLLRSTEDTSRFTAFDLLDSVYAGDGSRCHKILAALRAEATSIYAILYPLTTQLGRGAEVHGLPPAKRSLIQGFFRRKPDVALLLAECATIDQQGKGAAPGDAWQSLEQLLLFMAGVKGVGRPSRYRKFLRWE